ncbi:hypothetical protein J3F83DRAFT_587893 [Trichoderma novae-zelandiae]
MTTAAKKAVKSSNMPRKFITQEVKDQNRESQRRSRARRLELINDLKSQVREYQRQGASASLEMQRLAQAVTHENQRLRSLLRERGVSPDEIQQCISSSPVPCLRTPDALYSHEPGFFRCEACGSTSILREPQPAILMAKQPHSYQSSPQTAGESSSSPSPERARHATDTTGAETTPFTLPPAVASTTASDINPRCSQVTTSEAQSCQPRENPPTHSGASRTSESDTQRSKEPEPSFAASRPDAIYARKSPGHHDDMETSCDTAASILVDLHHHVDPERARAALGCKGSSSCTVSNIKIFQLLDKFS